MADNRNRSKNIGDFRPHTDSDWDPDTAYKGQPENKVTNDSIGNMRRDSTKNGQGLIGINDPRPEAPAQAAQDLMEKMQENATTTYDKGSSTPRNNLLGYGR